ncbi:MAG: MerR family transcriptional regulator [Cyanobacteria bacterium J06635_15]
MRLSSSSDTAVRQSFTRQEALILTKTTTARLAYLARTGIVVPQRGEQLHPVQLVYTWEQILEIRAINHLRRKLSLQTIRKIVEFLGKSGFDTSLKDKYLVVINDDVGWVMPDWSDVPQVMKVAGKNVGQFMLVAIPPLNNLIDDIWHTARSSNVIDFEHFRQRAQPTD